MISIRPQTIKLRGDVTLTFSRGRYTSRLEISQPGDTHDIVFDDTGEIISILRVFGEAAKD